MLQGEVHHLTELAKKLRQLTYEDGASVFTSVSVGLPRSDMALPYAVLATSFSVTYYVEPEDERQVLAIAEKLHDAFDASSGFGWATSIGQLCRTGRCYLWAEKTRHMLGVD